MSAEDDNPKNKDRSLLDIGCPIREMNKGQKSKKRRPEVAEGIAFFDV